MQNELNPTPAEVACVRRNDRCLCSTACARSAAPGRECRDFCGYGPACDPQLHRRGVGLSGHRRDYGHGRLPSVWNSNAGLDQTQVEAIINSAVATAVAAVPQTTAGTAQGRTVDG